MEEQALKGSIFSPHFSPIKCFLNAVQAKCYPGQINKTQLVLVVIHNKNV